MFEFIERQDTQNTSCARIKVIGIGGAGGNTINSMIASGFEHVEFIVANTDTQALERSKATHIIKLGSKLTKGLGSGANPEVGRRATEEDLDAINEHLDDADIVFLTAGLGGGTGTGGMPVVARSLRERDILSVAVVTKPFSFEGKRRMRVAEEALQQLKSTVDCLIVIPNQKLIEISTEKIALLEAFEMVNGFIGQFVRSISEIITRHGHINVDFADIQSIMRHSGTAVMGSGRASGENRAEEATIKAISSPLLEEQGVKGARGVLINITGSSNIGLHEVSSAAQLIYDQADEDASIVLGSVIDDSLGDEISVTIIATGFGPQPEAQATPTIPTLHVKPSVPEIQMVAKPAVTIKREETKVATSSAMITTAPLSPEELLEVPAMLRKNSSHEQQKSS
ncbi:TPA: cell division protein FtsZ [Candidatus Dependentiae bacterium]|nr:MAG: Cell division protein FtsZ [candidate division TM6 bacterium GW2011_GWF2_43_87]HBL98861.1 cell division protein FtsZ [Candidatus Dependentiae bacterium]